VVDMDKITEIKLLLEKKRTERAIVEKTTPLFSDLQSKILEVKKQGDTSLSKLNKIVADGQSEARTSVLKSEQHLLSILNTEIALLEKEIKAIEMLKPIDGKDGLDGKDGTNGDNGKDGIDGIDGVDGKDGLDGKDGESIKANGIEDAELKDGDLILTFSNGNKKNVGRVKGSSGSGTNGKSAYTQAQEGGYTGTEEQFAILLANIGGGGHVIKSATQTMTQRENLKFIGATLTDDGINTIVTVTSGGGNTYFPSGW
jgi:hypothetical protein